MDIIKIIKKYVKKECKNYKKNAIDHYDFWSEHIKYVYKEAVGLAKKYNADIEIVSLGALLHDIALVKKVGDKKDHHINGKVLANEILSKYNYPEDKKQRVLNSVLHHRKSINAENIEELCVCDADILAHFDNIRMITNSVRNKNNDKENINEIIIKVLEDDFNDLSDKTKKEFNEKYKKIIKKVRK